MSPNPWIREQIFTRWVRVYEGIHGLGHVDPHAPGDRQGALQGRTDQGRQRRPDRELPEEFAAPTELVSEDGAQLLKFHGVYQQDDRDQRAERGPGEAFGDFCDRVGPDALRKRIEEREVVSCS